MRDVSCNVLDVLFRGLRTRQISGEFLAEGSGYPLTHLRKRNERIEWDAFARVMANAGKIWTPDELVGLGLSFFDAPLVRPISVVARLLFNAEEFYAWMFDEKKGIGTRGFGAAVSNSVEKQGPGRLRVQLRINESYCPCPEFFYVCKGNFTGMPRLLGLPPAEVMMELGERRATFQITVPEGAGLLRRLKGAIAWPFAARAAAVELERAHEALVARYHELHAARESEAKKAEQLKVVNELGRELARHQEIERLADALGELVTGRLKFSGIRLLTGPLSGSDEVIERRTGDTSGFPQRRITLETGGKPLATLDVYASSAPAADGDSLLNDLAPWISIALANSWNFHLLASARHGLERKVAERTQELLALTNRLEESLQRVTDLDRQKTDFFANASHELRTPLTLILAPLEAALQIEGLPGRAQEEVRAALRSGYRMMKLVNDLLDLAKLEAGRMHLRVTSIDLARLLEEAIRPWRPALQKRGVRLDVSVPASLPTIGDGERLEQVALNLMSNAVKNVPDGGWIKVSAFRQANGLAFRIENQGEGVDSDEVPLLFDRFTQSVRSRLRRFGSSGLGLPLVKEIVELHGGQVTVDNVPGERIAFVVSLPNFEVSTEEIVAVAPALSRTEVLQYGVEDPAEKLPTRHLESTERPLLLLVEDQPDLRSFLARSLSGEYSVVEASHGAEALALAKEHRPAIVLTDIMMPVLSGIDLCVHLKADPATAAIPVILLTARADLESRLSGLRSGADDFVIKPFHVEEVRARLQVHLRLRTLTQRVVHSEKLAALGTVVAGVAHELRNPVNGILNSLLPLKEAFGATSEARDLLDIALVGAQRVSSLSDQIVRQALPQPALDLSIDLAENVNLAVRLLAHKTRLGPTLSVNPPPSPVCVRGDPGSLSQVWINLLDNAVQAAGSHGRVEVRIASLDNEVVVEVEDNGPGISSQHVARVFDPFFTTRSDGTGLGLFLTREVVKQHRGEISLTSFPKRGTRFTVTLPRA